MKLLLIILIMISMKSYSQENLVKLQDYLDYNNDYCKNIYVDTTDISKSFLEAPEIIYESDYQTKIYSDGPFSYSEGFTNKLKMFSSDSLELGTKDIKSDFNEIKNKLEELEVQNGKILFKRTINTMNQNETVEIYFEKYVNCVSIENELKEIFNPVNCTFDCYPAKLVQSVVIPIENILVQSNNSLVFSKQVEKVRITDFLGSYTELEYKPNIDISSYKRGVYILQFTYENKIYNYKFIKE